MHYSRFPVSKLPLSNFPSLQVDAAKALALPGVKHFISKADVPDGCKNFQTWGGPDENLFALDEVLFVDFSFHLI